MLLEDLDGLVEPARVHDHAGGGERALVEQLLQRHVAGVAEAEVVGADDQADLVVAEEVERCGFGRGGGGGSSAAKRSVVAGRFIRAGEVGGEAARGRRRRAEPQAAGSGTIVSDSSATAWGEGGRRSSAALAIVLVGGFDLEARGDAQRVGVVGEKREQVRV